MKLVHENEHERYYGTKPFHGLHTECNVLVMPKCKNISSYLVASYGNGIKTIMYIDESMAIEMLKGERKTVSVFHESTRKDA